MNYLDRDLSWLAFNDRILLEAENEHVPLMERLNFVAIFSSNLEEFYKVRVANHRFAQKYKGDKKNKHGYRSSYILQQINQIVDQQQERLGLVFFSKIIPGLGKSGIHLLSSNFTKDDEFQISEYYHKNLEGKFTLMEITNEKNLHLKNQQIYLYLVSQGKRYLLELDYNLFGRFIDISTHKSDQRIVQLDDIFKKNVTKFLPTPTDIFAVKISRDAELYIDEEQDDHIVKKIKKSLNKRETGLPSRLLFDENISFKNINALRKIIDVDMSGLIPGGRYHNFYDYFGFPVEREKSNLFYPVQNTIPHARLEASSDWFEEVKKKPVFLSFPYQKYDYVTRFLLLAAKDKAVEEINITLYRVAKDSEICKALEIAAKGGKKVFVLDEVQARFDEEANIYWGDRLIKAGATVKYGVNNLKVHAKIFTVKRREGKDLMTYSYLGTGNFNEKTAKIYGDHALITTQHAYSTDLDEVFKFLKNKNYKPTFSSLLVAPFNLRSTLEQLIDKEIQLVNQGKEGKIVIKLNSLEDVEMIEKIRTAANSGVQIELIVRGICCYYPQTEMQYKNIKVVSVVDQFLEHTRIYHFHNDGDPKTYLASADWMTRNLTKRIEVAFPIFDKKIQRFLQKELSAQLHDSVKGRYITSKNKNQNVHGNEEQSSQRKMFELVKQLYT
jgi:polyphosphate kinase